MAFGWDDALMLGAPMLAQLLSNRHSQPAPLPVGSGPWSKVPAFISGGGGGGSSASSTSSTSYNRTTTPFILPEYQGLMGTLRKQMEARLAGSGMPAGFEDYGLRQINDTYRGGETAATNQLIGRGLLGSPAEATAFAQQFALPRIGEMSNFRASLPLQERQFKNEDWSMIQQLLDAFGKGQNEKGSSTTHTTSTSGGGGGGGMMPNPQYNPPSTERGPSPWQNLIGMIGYLAGSGAFHGKSNPGTQPYGPGMPGQQ